MSRVVIYHSLELFSVHFPHPTPNPASQQSPAPFATTFIITRRSSHLCRLRNSLPVLFQERIQRVPNVMKSRIHSPVDDVSDKLAELQVLLGVLKEEACEPLNVIVSLILLPRNVKPCLGPVHGYAEGGAADGPGLLKLALSEFLVEPFRNVDTRGGPPAHWLSATQRGSLPLNSTTRKGHISSDLLAIRQSLISPSWMC